MTKKLTDQQVDDILQKVHLKRLEEYKNSMSSFDVICENGHVTKKLIGVARDGGGCQICANRVPHSQEYAEQVCRSFGWELLGLYYNNRSELPVKCKNGHVCMKDITHIQRGQGCAICSRQVAWTNEAIDEWLIDNAPDFVRLSDYEHANRKTLFFCKDCQMSFLASWNKFHNAGTRCPKCCYKRISGSNHYRYNPSLTEQDRQRERNYMDENREWKKAVFKRDRYTCQVTGAKGTGLNAHHLNAYSHFPSERYDVQNGIVLAEQVHKTFHSLYGYGKNTRRQFVDFLKRLVADTIAVPFEISIDITERTLDRLQNTP